MMREPTTGHVILGVLATTGVASGYEIRQFIQQSVGYFWNESYGQIYPHLRSLEDAGLVEPVAMGHGIRTPAARASRGANAAARAPGERATRGARGRKRFRITTAGRKALRAWLQAPARPEHVRVEFLVKIFFGHEAPPDTARAHVAAVGARHRERLVMLERLGGPAVEADANAPQLVFWLLALRHGQIVSRARVRWSDDAARLLDAAARGGNRAVLATWRALTKEEA